MRRHAVALAALALAGLPACASIDSGVNKGTEILSEVVLPTPQEIELGNQLAAQVNQEEPVLNNSDVQTYVNNVGQKLARASVRDRQGIKYSFTVIDKPDTVNAFALPGGHIYVYTGLIKMVDNEAELAAVLGHEVAHVTQRHGAEALVKQLGIETIAGLALGQNPGMIPQIATGIAAQGYMARNSRAAESEADAHGLDYLVRAGYDPNAMPTMFKKLAKAGGTNPNALEAFFASHPDPLDRAKVTQQTIARKNLHGGQEQQVGDIASIKSELGSRPSLTPKTAAPKPAASGSSGGGSSTPMPRPKPK